VLNVAWYRFGATFRRRWPGYLTIVLLVGLLGGLAMGSIAGARRTQSSFATFLASTNPSALRLGTAAYNPSAPSVAGYNPAAVKAIANLPHVAHVESAVLLDAVPYLGPNGDPEANAGPAAGDPTNLNTIGSVNGLYFNQDRVTITKGRMADPARADEIVVQASQAQGVRVGQVIDFGVYTNAQETQPGFSTASAPFRRVEVKVVGIGVSNDAVVTDAVDSGGSFTVLFTPAFTHSLINCCAKATPDTDIQVGGASRNVTTVEDELAQLYHQAGGEPNFYVTSVTEAKAERTIKPEAVALGVFGAIAGLATLFIAGQAIGRQLRLGANDLPVLRALGATPSITASESLIGIAGSVVVGAVLAVVVAIALSPLAPIGLVRGVYPDAGLAFDWPILILGLVVLIATLGGFAMAAARRQSPHRAAQRERQTGLRGSALSRWAGTAGLPAPTVVGIRFALDPGIGRNSVPVRSAILGISLAVVVITATLTFGSSLHTLVSRPALYGWNWNDEILAGGGATDIPQKQATELLDQDRDVTASAGVYFATLDLDGQLIPVLGGSPGAAVTPPMLSGHPFDAPDQVVLGARTLAQLHKHIGDTVRVSSGGPAHTSLRIVGTAAMPAIGSNFSQHLEMGTGALLSYKLIPTLGRNRLDVPLTGPNAILVRLRAGASAGSLNRIANTMSNTADEGVNVESVQRPAEIINYRSLGTTPALLGLALAVGAVFAFGLTLVSSVRRRRHEMALLKTLGFTRRQLASVIAWQSNVAVAVGAVVGVPIGIVFGRWLWDLFARSIDVVPVPNVPVTSIVLTAVGALALANLVAAVPGLIAARTKTASLLRAE
jgi:hypothetical protein